MSNYQEEPKQEPDSEMIKPITNPNLLTIFLGHAPKKEIKGITPDQIFTFPISFTIPMVTSYSTLDAFYADLASYWVAEGEQQRQAAALMGGANEWEQLRNDPSVTVRMAVAWAAEKPIQLKMANDPDPNVREYLARFGDDDVRQLLLDNELQQSPFNHEVLSSIAKHIDAAPMEEHAIKALWEQPELLQAMLRDMRPHKAALAMLAKHKAEEIRVVAAMRAAEDGDSEVVQTVLHGALSQFNREIIEELAEEIGSEKSKKTSAVSSTHAANPRPLPEVPTSPVAPASPVVTIVSSAHKEIIAGQAMTLSEADVLFQKLDRQIMDTLNATGGKEAGLKRVSFRIEFTLNGDLQVYEGQQDLGDGDGSLLDHIRDYQEFCATSAEWKNHVIETKGAAAWEEESAEHQFVLSSLLPAMERVSPSSDELSKFAEQMYNLTRSAIPDYIPAEQSCDDSIAGLVQHIRSGDKDATCFPLEKIRQVGTAEQREEATRLLKEYLDRADFWSDKIVPITVENKPIQHTGLAI